MTGSFENAVKLASAGKYEEALDEISRVEMPGDGNIEDSINILTQTAVCRAMLGEYAKAEEAALGILEYREDYAAYELLSVVYDITGEKDKAYPVYKRLSEMNPLNVKAKLRVITYDNRSSEEDYITALKYMDELVASGALKTQPLQSVVSAFNTCYETSKRLCDAERALGYFDSNAAFFSPEERETSEIYRNMLSAAFSLSVYSEHYSDDKIIEMMHEMHRLNKPAHVNEFSKRGDPFGDITIAYLSSDFYYHPVGRFLNALFAHKITNSGVRHHCYDTNTVREEDHLTALIRHNADKYVKIGSMSEDEAEETILSDAPDILIDLNGVSSGNRRELVIRRLAPVQLTWIGFPCTCAAGNVDYNIVDYVTDPVGESERFYTEKLAYMRKTFLCYPVMHDLSDEKLSVTESPFTKNGYITFGSFNNALKFTGRTLRNWNEILSRTEGARLRIISSNGTNDEISQNALKRRFASFGVDLSRVDFCPSSPFLNDYFTFYRDVDIILDTFPFNGATTTCDAFLMGVPVVSMYGNKHVARVGLSMLKNVGLEDLAAGTDEGFIETARKLAQNKNRLISIRKRLRRVFLRSPLTDTAAFKAEFEMLMRKLYIEKSHEERDAALKSKELSVYEYITQVYRAFFYIQNLIADKNNADALSPALKEVSALLSEISCLVIEDNKTLADEFAELARLFGEKTDYAHIPVMIGIGNNLLNAVLRSGGI